MIRMMPAIDVQKFDTLIEPNSLLTTIMENHVIIAKSPVTLEKLEIADKVATTDSPVLILGESGTGKGIFAERIHLKSRRGRKPFVRINRAVIPEGLFEQAAGGTVFLDEAGDLPFAL